MEASAALAMVRSSSNSFQFTDELVEFPEITFDLVESELAFRSELEFLGLQQWQGRWLASRFEFNFGLELEVEVEIDSVSYSDSNSGMRRVRSLLFCFG